MKTLRTKYFGRVCTAHRKVFGVQCTAYQLCVCAFSLCIFSAFSASAAVNNTFTSPDTYFKIQVVDRQTGRGVPLVALRTVNNIRYYTDSNGIVAFHEPGLMGMEVFFHVENHGYEFPKDGFGMRGKRLKTTPSKSAVIEIDRINIAERLYRVTGQGIYRDSILTDTDVPLRNPALNGKVMGQDSVFACIYHGRLFWMWGDTGRPSYPLGNFAMSGAVSDLPGRGGLDPSMGVDLEYYVGEDGFSRKMCPLEEHGLVWLDGLMTVQDPNGNERMVAKFARLKGLGEVLERGLVVFNDEAEIFEPILRPGLELLPYRNTGHAFPVEVNGQPYYYFTAPSPMGARLRVRAQWADVIDPNRYEVLTAVSKASRLHEGRRPSARAGKMPATLKGETLSPQQRPSASSEQALTTSPQTVRPLSSDSRWISFGDLIFSLNSTKGAVIEDLEEEAEGTRVYDIESGETVRPHNGSVYYNTYRQKWIGIFVQQFGNPSNLGEVWYAEADTPVGSWAYARKILTHDKYSFYNPKQHPFFDQEGGRIIYFEGTYSHTFSGSAEAATPRYDYNQIMYRLNLADPRLALPAAVYEVRGKEGRHKYLLCDGVEAAGKWGSVESVAFYAIEPGRQSDDLVPIYPDNAGLSAERPGESARPLFYAAPNDESTDDNEALVPLYEYHNADTGQRRYSTKPARQQEGRTRTTRPLCCVWKAPPGPLLLDSKAKPAAD